MAGTRALLPADCLFNNEMEGEKKKENYQFVITASQWANGRGAQCHHFHWAQINRTSDQNYYTAGAG